MKVLNILLIVLSIVLLLSSMNGTQNGNPVRPSGSSGITCLLGPASTINQKSFASRSMTHSLGKAPVHPSEWNGDEDIPNSAATRAFKGHTVAR
ncbi:hypothetical protein CJ030_MR6G007068 [Morella rubra]|uniref:Uncharacterized protein n=1 Tax=Morella rubra TaxID=262757 RepID=A0A6A1VAA6_9ROSI|nr:hypothetical protein CJ030_MR6G007068 [Morella rubra]